MDDAAQVAAARASGADAIELNFYQLATDPAVDGQEIEERIRETVESVARSVRVPVAVKLSPFHAAPANFVARLEAAEVPCGAVTGILEALESPLQALVAAVRMVLEQTPPELSSDIIDKGMVMSGGGALLRNIDKLLTQVTGVPCHVAENPLDCVALGTGLALEHFDFFKKSLVSQV